MSNLKSINGNGNGKPIQVQVSPDDLTFIECECGSRHFQQAYKIGRLSKVHPKNPTGETQIVTIPVHVCLECGAEIKPNQIQE